MVIVKTSAIQNKAVLACKNAAIHFIFKWALVAIENGKNFINIPVKNAAFGTC